MLGPSDLDRVGTRRILTCPYCDQLQYIIPRPTTFVIGCRNCHRAFRVIETGAGRAAVRADEPAILPMGRPGRCPIDRRIEPAGGTTEQAAPRSHGGRSKEMLPWLRAPWVFPWVLAAAVAAMHVLLTIFGTVRMNVRRSLPEGSMTTVGRDEVESDPHPGRVDVEARGTPPRGDVAGHQE